MIPKEYRFDTFTADRVEKFIVAWNTNLVRTPPKSFQDLADPKWKGKLSMEPTDADWYGARERVLHHAGEAEDDGGGGRRAVQEDRGQLAADQRPHEPDQRAGRGPGAVVVTGHAQATEQLQAKKAPIAFTRSCCR